MFEEDDLRLLIGNLKKGIKNIHMDIMSKISPEERKKIQSELDKKISEAKAEHNDDTFNNFMKDIYGI